MKKVVTTLMIFSLIIVSISPGIWAQDDPATEFLRRRIKIVPVKSGKEIKTEKHSTTTVDTYGYFAVQDQWGEETVKIDPSRIEDFEAYKGGRRLGDIELLKTVGEYNRAQQLQSARGKDNLGFIVTLVGGAAAMGGVVIENTPIMIGGVVGMVGGGVISGYSGQTSLSFHEAAQVASIYNRELKKELDLSKEEIEEAIDDN